MLKNGICIPIDKTIQWSIDKTVQCSINKIIQWNKQNNSMK